MQAFSEGLQLSDVNYFSSKHSIETNTTTTLRFLHYIATNHENMNPSKDGKSIRCGRHSDYGTLTLLFQNGVAGLEVLNPASILTGVEEYIPVEPKENHIVVNIGDLLQLWTSSFLLSAQHRVVGHSQGDQDRYSIAYFWHANEDVLLKPIPSPVIQESILHDSNEIQYAELKRLSKLAFLPPVHSSSQDCTGMKLQDRIESMTSGSYLKCRLASTYH